MQFSGDCPWIGSFVVRPLTRAGIALCVGLFTWTACNVGPHKTSAPSPTATPQPQIVTTRLTALLTGELVLEDNCLRVAGYLLAWPPEFTVDIREDTVEVADGLTGEQVLREFLTLAEPFLPAFARQARENQQQRGLIDAGIVPLSDFARGVVLVEDERHALMRDPLAQ